MGKKTEINTPEKMGFRMPAEWEKHDGTWLGWPHELTDWPGKFAPIPWAFAEIVRLLSHVERVFLLVETREAETRVRAILSKAGAKLDASAAPEGGDAGRIELRATGTASIEGTLLGRSAEGSAIVGTDTGRQIFAATLLYLFTEIDCTAVARRYIIECAREELSKARVAVERVATYRSDAPDSVGAGSGIAGLVPRFKPNRYS